jgi:hypothetical protein
MFSGGNRTIGRSQNPSINTEIDVETNPQGTLKVEDGIKNLLLLGVRPNSGLINEENSLGNNRSSTSFFSVEPIYFNLFQIFEHLGKNIFNRNIKINLISFKKFDIIFD